VRLPGGIAFDAGTFRAHPVVPLGALQASFLRPTLTRVKEFFRDLDRDYICQRQPDHRERQRHGQRDEAENRVDRQVGDDQGVPNHDRAADQQHLAWSAAPERTPRAYDQCDDKLGQQGLNKPPGAELRGGRPKDE
jgi:hypothetical protein